MGEAQRLMSKLPRPLQAHCLFQHISVRRRELEHAKRTRATNVMGKERKLGVQHQLEFGQGRKMAREKEGTEQTRFYCALPYTSMEASLQNGLSPTAPFLTSSLHASFLMGDTLLSKCNTPQIYHFPSVCLSTSLAFLCSSPSDPTCPPPSPPSHVPRIPSLPLPILHLGGGSLPSMAALASFSTTGLCWMPPSSLGSPLAIMLTLFFCQQVSYGRLLSLLSSSRCSHPFKGELAALPS